MTSLNIFAEAHTESDLLASEVGIDNVEAFGRMLAGDESNANRRRALVLSWFALPRLDSRHRSINGNNTV